MKFKKKGFRIQIVIKKFYQRLYKPCEQVSYIMNNPHIKYRRYKIKTSKSSHFKVFCESSEVGRFSLFEKVKQVHEIYNSKYTIYVKRKFIIYHEYMEACI